MASKTRSTSDWARCGVSASGTGEGFRGDGKHLSGSQAISHHPQDGTSGGEAV